MCAAISTDWNRARRRKAGRGAPQKSFCNSRSTDSRRITDCVPHNAIAAPCEAGTQKKQAPAVRPKVMKKARCREWQRASFNYCVRILAIAPMAVPTVAASPPAATVPIAMTCPIAALDIWACIAAACARMVVTPAAGMAAIRPARDTNSDMNTGTCWNNNRGRKACSEAPHSQKQFQTFHRDFLSS
jgi:hypothetical protein